MSEEAAQGTPDENPDDPAAAEATAEYESGSGSGSRGRLMILIGALLLLGGTFLGSRLGKFLPSGWGGGPAGPDAVSPGGAPGGGPGGAPGRGPGGMPGGPGAPAGTVGAAFLHYFNICEFVERDGRQINLINVVPQLRPPTLPAPGSMHVVLAVSADSPARKLRLKGVAPGGAEFFNEELGLDPVDPTRPAQQWYPVEVELTSPDPLRFELFADDVVVARRFLFVRPRDMDPTTGPTTQGSDPAPPTFTPGGSPGPASKEK